MRVGRFFALALVVVPPIVGAAMACSNQPNAADAGLGDASPTDASRDVVPPHRTTGACTALPGAGTPFVSAGGCASDLDCDAGLNGRCDGTWMCEGGTLPCAQTYTVNVCVYDTCMSDTACGDAACTCREDFPLYSGMSDTCASTFGNCRTDSDCPNGEYCSPSWVYGCFPPTYFCHTPQDECIVNSDCTTKPDALNSPACVFDPAKSHWACMKACADAAAGP